MSVGVLNVVMLDDVILSVFMLIGVVAVNIETFQSQL
jgi:hypothetical protein